MESQGFQPEPHDFGQPVFRFLEDLPDLTYGSKRNISISVQRLAKQKVCIAKGLVPYTCRNPAFALPDLAGSARYILSLRPLIGTSQPSFTGQKEISMGFAGP